MVSRASVPYNTHYHTLISFLIYPQVYDKLKSLFYIGYLTPAANSLCCSSCNHSNVKSHKIVNIYYCQGICVQIIIS